MAFGFEFATAGRIIFGNGKFAELAAIASSYGRRALVVTGGRSGDSPAAQIIADMQAKGLSAERFSVQSEPDIGSIAAGLAVARAFEPDLVIGLGGGATMDTAKALAALYTNPGEALDYLEVVGKGQAITELPLPCICLPTTSGTGSEVTRNSVIGVPERQVKVSMRSPLMLPRIALIDPALTYNLPPELTAYTGLDALTQ